MERTCRKLGLDCVASKLTLSELKQLVKFPCIAHTNNSHYVVLFDQGDISERILVHDPNRKQVVNISTAEFKREWIANNKEEKGYVLIFGTKQL